MEEVKKKSGKREVAITMLLFISIMFCIGIYNDNDRAIDVAKFLTTPSFLFAAAAFGMEGLKQLKGSVI